MESRRKRDEAALPAREGELSHAPTLRRPSFAEAWRFWLKLGFVSFGGPTGQITIMHTDLVEKKRWISEHRFLHALNFCMLLPGPEAQQLATYIGWSLHGTWGGVVAGALFVLPAALILWALSWLYMAGGDLNWVAAVFYGLQPAVVAIVAAALLRIGGKALRNPFMWLVAVLAFVALFFFNAPFVLIILAAGLLGLTGSRLRPDLFVAHADPIASGNDLTEAENARPLRRTLRIAAVCLMLWFAPVVVAGLTFGWDHILVQEGAFFSKAALVTFGGAYAVLPYVAQQAVENYGWLETSQMMAGLGLAETTPGPLIMVLQFVGFVGAWQQPGDLPPLLAGTLGAAISTWTTFLPSFLFVLVGAPFIEPLRHFKALSSALSTITAAVVGVILNLAVWFGQHVLFPALDRPDYYAIALATVFLAGLWKGKWSVVFVVIAGGLSGLAGKLLVGP
jgi:chromate transporter